MTLAGGQILGDEYSDHVVRVLSLPQFPLAHMTLIYIYRIVAALSSEKGTSLLTPRTAWKLRPIQNSP